MFPAGRIMHLVPARLVPGTAAYATAAAAAASEEQQAATGSASQPGSPPAATAAEAGAAAGEDAPAVIAGIGEAEHNSASTVHRRGKHAAKLSVSDLIAGEGLLGRHPSDAGASADACEGGDGGDCGEQQGAAAAGQQQPQQMEEMVLLDDVPQQSYSRIRLCRYASLWAAAAEGAMLVAGRLGGCAACLLTPPTKRLTHPLDPPTLQDCVERPHHPKLPARPGKRTGGDAPADWHRRLRRACSRGRHQRRRRWWEQQAGLALPFRVPPIFQDASAFSMGLALVRTHHTVCPCTPCIHPSASCLETL